MHWAIRLIFITWTTVSIIIVYLRPRNSANLDVSNEKWKKKQPNIWQSESTLRWIFWLYWILFAFFSFPNDQETYGAQIYKHFIGKTHWTWEANIWWQPVTTSMETRRTLSPSDNSILCLLSQQQRHQSDPICKQQTMHTIESSIFITHASWQTRSCTHSIEVNDSSKKKKKKTLKNRCNWQGLQHPIQTNNPKNRMKLQFPRVGSCVTVHAPSDGSRWIFSVFPFYFYGQPKKIPHFICSHPFQSIFVGSHWLNAVNETANAIILNSSRKLPRTGKRMAKGKTSAMFEWQRTVTLNHFRVHIIQSFCGRSDKRRRDDNIDKRI